ncbi:trypsin-like peptidase domain-containing protein [Lysobacter silvisoli]|uniref:Serine protease n=1 Tax=Lysobacter silvisoli TaxID=2293254 RepID=A0A371K1N5_9GAMM|nr:trypsin-like peptidase domain-containing protein [Lysobacter silvisoli]RDZ27849.1 hypothetical protein DX914_01385 [Lysobacter silvisoli]
MVDGAQDEVETRAYCAPVFIGDRMQLQLQDPTLRSEDGEQALLRNGTLTFVSYQGATYALTCRHVIQALQDLRERERASNLQRHGVDFPERQRPQLFVPHGDDHIHVNARFYAVPADHAGEPAPDAAIARVADGLPARFGARAIPFERLDADGDEDRRGQTAVAAGYVEAGRRLRPRNELIATLVVRFVEAVAALTTIDGRYLRMIHELDAPVDANNLSGMSGGPVFWHDGERWGLAGIVVQGRDLQPKAGGDSAFAGPTLWVEGERVTRQRLSAWVAAIPGGDAPLEDLSMRLYIPNALRS